uniref:type IV secretory system conjugative DNA transfer family protein n=1 Tax=Armatimonas sp. TaxID=1872638 RepID=UPI0037500E62
MIKLGNRLEEHHQEAGAFRILCDDSELMQHLDRPWLRAYACEHLGLPMPLQSKQAEHGAIVRPVAASEEQLQRHSVVCGASGSGKTRLALHMLVEQIRAGASVVMLDPKKETLLHLLVMAREAGIKPEQVTLLVPGSSDEVGVPGWNPLDYKAAGSRPSRIAADFISILHQNNPSWGPRMEDVLSNALIILSSHGLSLYELTRFLTHPDYRASILSTPIEPPERKSFAEAHEYFTMGEFFNWSTSEKASAIGPVMNKLRPFLRTDFLLSLLCAKRNTMDLASLWKEQRLILVHLDRVELGDTAAQLLGGLLAWGLYRTAMETEGPVPVCLAMDEMGVSEKFIGSAVCEILAIARSRNLRLLVACQHLAQLSDGLR